MNPQSLPLSCASHVLKNNAPAHRAGSGSGTWDGCLTTSFSYSILHLQISSLSVKKICDFSLYKGLLFLYCSGVRVTCSLNLFLQVLFLYFEIICKDLFTRRICLKNLIDILENKLAYWCFLLEM